MLAVTVLCVGKLKEEYWRKACAEYAKRLSPYCRFSIVEVDEARVPERPSEAQIEAALREEGRRLLARAPVGALLTALCIEGETADSKALSRSIQAAAVGGKSQLVYLIGGSWGLSDEVKQRCTARLSMSRMTFPHQLARVMLCEQLYRAFQIANDGKYHK